MPVEWLAGFRRRDVTNRLPPRRSQHGRAHAETVRKVVLHTTEGATAGGAFAAYDARAGRFTGGVHPHVTVDPYTRSRYQHVPLTRAAYSLKTGDRDGVIQIEIVGFTARTYSDEQVEWLGRAVLAPIFAAVPTIPRRRGAKFLGADAGLLAAPYPHGKARLSPSQWAAATGVLGHQHSWGDDHWDPGVSINVDRAIFYAQQELIPRPTPTTPTHDDGDDMNPIIHHDPNTDTTLCIWTAASKKDGRMMPHFDVYSVPRPEAEVLAGGGKISPGISWVAIAGAKNGDWVQVG